MRKAGFAAGVLLAALSLMGCSGGNNNDAGGNDAAMNGDTVTGDTGHPDAAPDGPQTASTAGAHCTDDTMCGANMVLTCQTTGLASNGICSATCANNAMQATERTECDGTGSTCLAIGDEGQQGASTLCTRTCRTGAMNSGCQADQVCTGMWLTHTAGPDAPGCLPFCHSDAECPSGQHCDQLGSCQATAVNTALKADGLPCVPANEPSMGVSTQCQGACFSLIRNDTQHGICVSVVDITNPPTQDTFCPAADGATILVQAPQSGDNLGYCVFRQCNCDADCMAPFQCVQNNGIGVCTFPDASATPPEHGTPTCTTDGGTGDASVLPDVSVPDVGVPDGL